MKFKFSELILLYMSDNTLLYEIVEMLGLEQTLKFLSVFEGEQITLPSREGVRNTIVNLFIYDSLKDEIRYDKVQQLAIKFKLKENVVLDRFNTVKLDLENSEILKRVGGIEKLEIVDVDQFALSVLD